MKPALPDSLVIQGILEKPVLLVIPDLQVKQELLGLQVKQERPDLLVILDRLVQRV